MNVWPANITGPPWHIMTGRPDDSHSKPASGFGAWPVHSTPISWTLRALFSTVTLSDTNVYISLSVITKREPSPWSGKRAEVCLSLCPKHNSSWLCQATQLGSPVVGRKHPGGHLSQPASLCPGKTVSAEAWQKLHFFLSGTWWSWLKKHQKRKLSPEDRPPLGVSDLRSKSPGLSYQAAQTRPWVLGQSDSSKAGICFATCTFK